MADSISRRLATICQWLLIAMFVAFFSALSLTKHAAFQTHGIDLGNYNQIVWNAFHGSLLRCTNRPPFGENSLAHHVQPVLLLIAPFYLLHEGPETLLLLQAAVVGLGAWPVAQIARHRLGVPWMGPLFAAVYLLFPVLEAGPTFELHPGTLAATFLAAALYAIERERYTFSILWLVPATLCKQEISLLVAMIGLYLILARKNTKLGAITTLASLALFLLWVQLILPSFNRHGQSSHLGRYAHLAENVADILVSIVKRPGKVWEVLREPDRLAYFWRIPLPAGHMSLLAPELRLLAMPTVAINVLSLFSAMYAFDFVHHSVPLVPFVVTSAIHGSRRLLKFSRRLLSHMNQRFLLVLLGGHLVFMSLFDHHFFGHTPLARPFRWPEISQHHRIGHQPLNDIPAYAAVSAQTSLNAHLSSRKQVFISPERERPEYIVLEVTAARHNVFELTDDNGAYQKDRGAYSGDPSLTWSEYHHIVETLLASQEIGIMEATDGYLVLQRDTLGSELPESFYSAFLVVDGTISRTGSVSFGDSLRLVGLILDPASGPVYYPNTYWNGTRNASAGSRIFLALVDTSVSADRVVATQELTISAYGGDKLWSDERTIRDRAFVYFPPADKQRALALMVGTQAAGQNRLNRLPTSVEQGSDTILVDHSARLLLLSPEGWGR